MATYVNDLRLKEIATGDESGTWGTSTNTNLELVAEAFSFGTEAITTNADTHTTTIADGATDPGRSIYLQYTGTLDSTCTITIGPNTVSKLWFIENATSGSQSIIIKQGSGATVTIRNGDVKAIYSDGAGSGGKMVDAFTDLHVNGLTSEVDGNTAALTVRSTDADANLGPQLTFDRLSSSPADGDITGKITFQAQNDASEDTVYSSIESSIVDASDGTEDGQLQINTKLAGTARSRMLLNSTETVFNDGSQDLDFRVETDTDANALFVQGNTNRVMLGFNANIAVAAINPHLSVVGTDNGSTSVGVVRYSADTGGPRLVLGKSRNGSIATGGGTIVQSGDTVGLIQFAADDGGDVATQAVQLLASVDGTPGTNDMPGRFVIKTTADGANSPTEHLRITDAGDIGIGDSAPSTKLHVTTSDQDDGITIECTNGGASAGPSLKLDRSSSGPADSDAIGEIEFSGRNDASQAVQYSKIFARADDVTDGEEDGELEIQTMLAGTAKSRVEFNRTETVFNEGSVDLDFRVESDGNANMLFVDGENDKVLIGTNTPVTTSTTAAFQVMGTTNNPSTISIGRFSDNANSPSLTFVKSRDASIGGNTIVASGDNLGSILFIGNDGVDSATSAARILGEVDGTPGANDMPGRLVFATTPDGSTALNEAMRINDSGDLLYNTTTDYGGKVNIARADNNTTLALVCTDSDAADGPILDFIRDTSSPATTDDIGLITFKSDDSAGNRDIYAQIEVFSPGVTSGSEQGRMILSTTDAGTSQSRIDMNTGETVFNNGSNDIDFRVESDGNTYALFVEGSSSNVGIGTSSPTRALSVFGDASGVISITSNSTDGISSLAFGDTADDNAGRVNYLNASDAMLFFTAATERMRIDSSGNVLVGTDSGDAFNTYAKLRMQNDNHAFLQIKANSAKQAGVLLGDTDDDFVGGMVYDNSDNSLQFTSGNAECLRIDSSGQILQGITTIPTGVQSSRQLISSSGTGAEIIAYREDNAIAVDDFVGAFLIGHDDNTATEDHFIGMWGTAASANGNMNLKFAAGKDRYEAGTSDMTISSAGDVSIANALSKGSGSFRIDHPLPAKSSTHHLVHSFVEGPQADLIYRGKVSLVGGSATVNVDTAAGMTEGTFEALCADVQCFTSNESGWAAVKGSVSGNTLTITAQDNTCTDTISWMVVGERKDQHMIDTNWTDTNGKVIVEPLKESN